MYYISLNVTIKNIITLITNFYGEKKEKNDLLLISKKGIMQISYFSVPLLILLIALALEQIRLIQIMFNSSVKSF